MLIRLLDISSYPDRFDGILFNPHSTKYDKRIAFMDTNSETHVIRTAWERYNITHNWPTQRNIFVVLIWGGLEVHVMNIIGFVPPDGSENSSINLGK